MLAILHPELNIFVLLPAEGEAVNAISCQGGLTWSVFSIEKIAGNASSSYVFPPDSVKLLPGCGLSFSFLSAPMEYGNRIFPHYHGYSQGYLETRLQIPGTGEEARLQRTRRLRAGPEPKFWCCAQCLYIYLKRKAAW